MDSAPLTGGNMHSGLPLNSPTPQSNQCSACYYNYYANPWPQNSRLACRRALPAHGHGIARASRVGDLPRYIVQVPPCLRPLD